MIGNKPFSWSLRSLSLYLFQREDFQRETRRKCGVWDFRHEFMGVHYSRVMWMVIFASESSEISTKLKSINFFSKKV